MSVNKVILVGRLGKDPEAKSYGDSGVISNFSLATSERRKVDGEYKSTTEWHNVTAFGKLADICNKHLAKGKQVYIEGKLNTSKYDKDGETRYSTKIIAQNITFLSGGEGNQSTSNESPQIEFDDDDIPF